MSLFSFEDNTEKSIVYLCFEAQFAMAVWVLRCLNPIATSIKFLMLLTLQVLSLGTCSNVRFFVQL